MDNTHDSNDLHSLIINKLKQFGIKHKEKKYKFSHNKRGSRLFRTPLHLLQQTDAFVASGKVVQVPKFIADACSCILEHAEIEGLFRKAGSAAKQREIRKSLQEGLALDKSYRVVDIANTVSYFFRELPEPLIPPYIHDTMLQCLLVGPNSVKALLLSCLLLPPIIINTLAYFMQFLHTLSINSKINKMTAENLAIVLTPSLLPHPDINSMRFKNYIKVVELLIENSEDIGSIPIDIADIKQCADAMTSHQLLALSQTPKISSANFVLQQSSANQNKKKRRSEMFSGLKRIVGSAIGSSENLISNSGAKSVDKLYPSNDSKLSPKHHLIKHATPCSNKTTKKRKFTDPVSAFSTKKRKDLLTTLPSNCGGLLVNTPKTIKPKTQSRISFGGNKQIKPSSANQIVATMERRWSLVSTGLSKYKNKEVNFIKKNQLNHEDQNGVIKEKTIVQITNKHESPNYEKFPISIKDEETINKMVSQVETGFSLKFDNISDDLQTSSNDYSKKLETCSGSERVFNKCKENIEDAEMLDSPETELLAQHLSKGLAIRRSIETNVCSPSTRQIGTIRNRSHEKIFRISRNQTWHINSTVKQRTFIGNEVKTNSLYPKSVDKRDQLNTLQTCTLTSASIKTPNKVFSDLSKNFRNEKWTPAESFFKPSTQNLPMEKNSITEFDTPKLFESTLGPSSISTQITPCVLEENTMLPPNNFKRKICSIKTPNSVTNISPIKPTDEDHNGRSSIARLRTQNAGMVLAKAKLFDEMIDINTNTLDELNFIHNDTPNLKILTKASNGDLSCTKTMRVSTQSPITTKKRTCCTNPATKNLHKHAFNNIIKDDVGSPYLKNSNGRNIITKNAKEVREISLSISKIESQKTTKLNRQQHTASTRKMFSTTTTNQLRSTSSYRCSPRVSKVKCNKKY